MMKNRMDQGSMVGNVHPTKNTETGTLLLVGEGLLVGGVSGFIALLYRVALSYAGTWLNQILAYIKGHPVAIVIWFGVLIMLAFLVGKLVKWEPMISGSGIPQVEGEINGVLEQNWLRVLLAKFVGGFLCLLGGLSLGREGPSIQLGAMAGKGVSQALKRGEEEQKYLMTCGASAGLAAAFHAPLAGVMFAMEEIHKGFSATVLISAMTASVTSDFVASRFLGLDPVFQFELAEALPQKYYWMLLLLGVLTGCAGVFYNWAMLKAQEWYRKAKWLNETGRIMIAFFIAGILGLIMPSVLGSGHPLIEQLTQGKMFLQMAIVILIVKFLFSAVSFGSGAPGGIFFPLLILGALIGGIFGMIGMRYFGLPEMYLNNLVLLAMAGFFTAIVRAPMTGIILLFEMSGSVSQFLSLTIVSVTAYAVATLLRSEPIYDSLLERILKK